MNILDIFRIIYESSRQGSFGLFVGSGFTKAVLNKNTQKPLKWNELLIKCCEILHIDINNITTNFTSSPAIATSICEELQKKENITEVHAELKLKELISQLIAYYPNVDQIQQYKPLLDALDLTWIITTNYDLLIDSLIDNSYSIGPENAMVAPKGYIPVYHIHGIRTEPNTIVITNSDYLVMSRPHEYRMDTLAMKLKESTSLMLGYSISDTNILSAIDIANNVYKNKTIDFQNNIIQFIHNKEIKENYKIEEVPTLRLFRIYGDSIERFLSDYKTVKEGFEREISQIEISNYAFVNAMKGLNKEELESFIFNHDYRLKVITWYNEFGYRYNKDFIRFINKAFEMCWIKAASYGAFGIYKNIIELIIDLLCNINSEYFHPMIFSSIISNFDGVAGMIGFGIGKSWSGMEYWSTHKNLIPKETLKEIYIISKQRNTLFYLLLLDSFPEIENELMI